MSNAKNLIIGEFPSAPGEQYHRLAIRQARLELNRFEQGRARGGPTQSSVSKPCPVSVRLGGMNDKHTRLWPALVFAAFCLIGFGAREAIGTVYGAAEARDLLEALSRAGLYLGSAIATASATTLALMLTLIGMLRRIETDFDRKTYKQVARIAKLSTATLMISFLVLLAFTLPIGEFENLPRGWYNYLYTVLFALTVLLVALAAASVTIVFMTIRSIISHITPGEDV